MSYFRDKSLKTPLLRASLVVCAAVLAAVVGPFEASAQELILEEIVFQGDGQPIGRDLKVGLEDGTPDARYLVQLLDEADEVVVSTAIYADGDGKAPLAVLWSRTGIAGCDPGVDQDPNPYVYKDHAEAESELDGREFRIEAYETLDGANLVAETEISFFIEDPELRAFPADGSGCLRTLFRYEDIYLSIRHGGIAAKQYHVFVVEPDPARETGDPLVDLRPGGSNLILVPPGAVPTVSLLWVDPVVNTPDGAFEIILREGGNPNGTYDATLDFSAGIGKKPGSTYPECTLCTIPENDGDGGG